MRPSEERLKELRTLYRDASERMRKIAGSFAGDLSAAGHPSLGADAISETERLMLRHRSRNSAILEALAQVDADPESTGDAVHLLEEGVRDIEMDLRALDRLAPGIAAAVASTGSQPSVN